jgi:hypothetical protein
MSDDSKRASFTERLSEFRRETERRAKDARQKVDDVRDKVVAELGIAHAQGPVIDVGAQVPLLQRVVRASVYAIVVTLLASGATAFGAGVLLLAIALYLAKEWLGLHIDLVPPRRA